MPNGIIQTVVDACAQMNRDITNTVGAHYIAFIFTLNFRQGAIVPVAYPIPGDGPVGDLLVQLGRHNMRPNHLHLMVTADGYAPLTTALYPEGDVYLASDAVFGVKKSLVVVRDANASGFVTRL
jgi:hypothetical protein